MSNGFPDKKGGSAALVARAAFVARILLLRRDKEPEFRSDAGQSNLRADPLGQERRGTCQVGKRE